MSDTPKTTSSDVPDRNDAPTNGWDSVFAINFANANNALVAGWPEVDPGAKKLSQSGSGFSIDGDFGPWQFTTGGDGKNIRMLCTFTSGTYNIGAASYDLAPAGGNAMAVEIEVGMEWVPNPDQKSFVISDTATVQTIVTDLDNNTIDTDLQQAFKDNGIPLPPNASSLVVTENEEWHITASEEGGFYVFHSADKSGDQFLYVYKYEKSWSENLKVLSHAVQSGQPAVVIVTIANNPTSGGVPGAVLQELASKWFNANISQFNHVFAILDLAPSVSSDDKYAWLKPTATSYAVAGQGSLESSLFGVLTMAEGSKAGDNHQVSPYAIPTGTGANGADAGFLISGPDFVKHMLLPGAQVIFDNAPGDAFEIINDHLTVQNTKELVWGKFMMDNKKEFSFSNDGYTSSLDGGTIPGGVQQEFQANGIYLSGYSVEVTQQGSQWLLTTGANNSIEYILSLTDGSTIEVYEATIVTIDAGHFKMSLNHTYVEIEFVGLKYSYSSDFDVQIDYTEQVVLSLKDKGGKQIFWFDQVLKKMVVSVTKTQSAITREIVEGAVTAALSLIAIPGPIIEGLSAGAEIGEVTEEGGQAIVDAKTFAQVAEDNPEAALEDEAATSELAAEQTTGRLGRIGRAIGTPKWKLAASMAALASAVVGGDEALTAIAEAAAKNEWEDVPGFDDFAEEVIAPYTFPSVTGFDLVSAWLAGSLQIGLKAKTTDAT